MKSKPIVFDFLSVLDKKDLKQVRKMLRSPFFNTSKSLQVFFEELIRFHPNMDLGFLEKKNLPKILFPNGEDPKGDKYRHLCAALNKLIKDYLVWKEISSKEEEKEVILLNVLQKKKATEQYVLLEKKIWNKQKVPGYHQPEFYKRNYEANLIRMEEFSMNKLQVQLDLINDSIAQLENFYQISKTVLIAKTNDLRTRLKFTEPRKNIATYRKNPIYRIYFLLRKLKKKYNAKYFQEAKELLFNYSDFFSKEIREEVLQFLLNSSITREKESKVLDMNILILYQWGLNNGFFLQNGYLRSIIFLNIVNKGLKQDPIWTGNFVEDNKKLLVEDEKNDVVDLAHSYIEFQKGNIEEAYFLITAKRYFNESVSFMSRCHEIKCGFELYKSNKKNYESFLSRLNANEQFFVKLKYQKELDKTKAVNLVRLLRKIMRRDFDKDFSNETRERLIFDFENTYQPIFYEAWLKKVESRFH